MVKKQAPVPNAAIKVVGFLLFIRVNQEFIKYAVENSSDSSLYTNSDDQAKGIIRDDEGTGIQVKSYQGDSKACLALLNQWVLATEQAFDVAEKNQRLPELIAHINKMVPLPPVVAYSALPNFKDLIQQIEGSLNKHDQVADYEIVFEFFKPYYNTQVIFNGYEVMLSQKHIVDYMIKTYSYTIPNFSTSPPLATAPVL